MPLAQQLRVQRVTSGAVNAVAAPFNGAKQNERMKKGLQISIDKDSVPGSLSRYR